MWHNYGMGNNHGPDNQGANRNGRNELGRYVPGRSGNPKGRPPASEIAADWIRRYAEQPHPGDPEARTRGQLVALAVYQAAIEGDVRAAKLVLDRIEPVPTNSITINNQVGASGLLAIEAIRSDPQRFRDMLKANGVDRN